MTSVSIDTVQSLWVDTENNQSQNIIQKSVVVLLSTLIMNIMIFNEGLTLELKIEVIFDTFVTPFH